MNRLKDAALLVLAILCIALSLSHFVSPPPVRAQGTADQNADMIAVTGTYASGASVLYVIDTKSRNLAVYETRNGRSLRLVAARKIDYDLRVDRFHDESEEAAQVPSLRKDWQRFDEIQRKASEERSSDKSEKKEDKK